MSITVTFNGADKTSNIRRNSLKIESNLTSEVDNCSLTILYYGTKNFKPICGDIIIITDTGTKIFGGIVAKVVEKMLGARLIAYDIDCADYTRLADKKLVAETYSGSPIGQIIADINTVYLSGFTVVNVNCDIVIDYVAFNYEQPSKCFQRLAELVGYDWYIDYDKDIHFFSKETNLAPFNLTDTSGNYVFSSLQIIKDISQIKNVIYVRGGEYLGEWFTENQFGDGVKVDFKTAYKYANIAVTVSGSPVSVGIDNLNDPALKDCLYNFNEKVVKFRDDNKPANGVPVNISGYPYIPVIIEARNQSSITANGEYQFRIIDKSIKTKAGARERGNGEITLYANQISEGNFITYTKGLKSGQQINIQSTIRNINETFLINRVSAIMRTQDEMEYNISLVSTKTMGIIEFLQKLLMADDRKLVINEDEVVDKLWSGNESFTLQEDAYLFHDPVSGPWYVSGGVGTPVGYVGFCSAS